MLHTLNELLVINNYPERPRLIPILIFNQQYKTNTKVIRQEQDSDQDYHSLDLSFGISLLITNHT